MKKLFLPLHGLFLILLIGFFLIPAKIASAADVGLIVSQEASYEIYEPDNRVLYKGTIMPWFSTPLGKTGRLYLSLGMTADYENEEWSFIPELMETEIKYRLGENSEIRAGRIFYEDPLAFIAMGLFDGVRYSTDIGTAGRLNIGAFYTGFLFKKSAYITITEDELDLYNEVLDYSNFYESYFAPRRLVAALDWEQWSLSELLRIQISLIGQFDLSGSAKLYHSQYLTGKIVIPVKAFVFELGGIAGLAENAQNYQVFFAGELGIAWNLPTPIHDKLSVTGRFSGGTINNTLSAFVPITTIPQGYILKAKLSGLSMIQAEYTARLHQSFSLQFFSSYFITSDMGTYDGIPDGRNGYFLGNEFYGQAVWSPFSDLQIKLGGGVFLPSLGDADKNGKAFWQIDLSAVVALF